MTSPDPILNTNKNVGTTYLDDNDILLTKDGGENDSLGRTAFGLFVYKSAYKELLTGILKCFRDVRVNNNFLHLQAYRYPIESLYSDWHWDTSRDHILYAIALLKICGEDKRAAHIANNLRTQVSTRFRMTPDARIWLRAIASSSSTGYFYLTIMVPIMLICVTWNKLLRTIGLFRSRTGTFTYNFDKDEGRLKRNRYRKFLSSLMFPTYAMSFTLWQIKALNRSLLRRILQRICLLDVERSNYVLRLVAGDNLNIDDLGRAKHYDTTRSFRWTTRLDESNDRDLSLTYDTPGNNIELDLLNELIYEYENS